MEHWAQTLRAAIGTRRVLLVIDDAWTLEDALALKVGGPACTHLLTTRFPPIALAFAANTTYRVQELDEQESVMLLQRLAPQVVQHEMGMAQTLVQAVGGLPLALVLIGNALHVQSYGGHARRVRQALERLHNVQARSRLVGPSSPLEQHPSLSSDLNNLGALAGHQGNYADEEVYYQQGLVLAQQIGHSEGNLDEACRQALASIITTFKAIDHHMTKDVR